MLKRPQYLVGRWFFIIFAFLTPRLSHADFAEVNVDVEAQRIQCQSQGGQDCESLSALSAAVSGENIKSLIEQAFESRSQVIAEAKRLLAVDEEKLKMFEEAAARTSIASQNYQAISEYLRDRLTELRWRVQTFLEDETYGSSNLPDFNGVSKGKAKARQENSAELRANAVRILIDSVISSVTSFMTRNSYAGVPVDLAYILQKKGKLPENTGFIAVIPRQYEDRVNSVKSIKKENFPFECGAISIPFDIAIVKQILGDENTKPVAVSCSTSLFHGIEVHTDKSERKVKVYYDTSTRVGIDDTSSRGIPTLPIPTPYISTEYQLPLDSQIYDAILEAAGVDVARP